MIENPTKDIGVAIFKTTRGWVYILHEAGSPVIDDFVITSGMQKTLSGAMDKARRLAGSRLAYFHRIDDVTFP